MNVVYGNNLPNGIQRRQLPVQLRVTVHMQWEHVSRARGSCREASHLHAATVAVTKP